MLYDIFAGNQQPLLAFCKQRFFLRSGPVGQELSAFITIGQSPDSDIALFFQMFQKALEGLQHLGQFEQPAY